MSDRTDDTGWMRLDARMLLVHPLRELIRFVPLLVVSFVAGHYGGEPWWTYALSGLGVLLGLSRWFTTRYRITPTHVQLRRGLLNRQLLQVPRDRIRSVEATSTALHRMVRLSVLRVGTGASQGKDELALDAVAARDVPSLRAELLRGTGVPALTDAQQGTTRGENISGWRPGWVRYAPFTFTGVASIVVVIAFGFQVQFMEGGALTRIPVVRSTWDWVASLPLSVLLLEGGALLVVVASLVAMARYVLSYWRFWLVRAPQGLQVGHGLLSTRQTTLDESRLRGVQLGEPLSLRLVGGAGAQAIMTGLGRARGGVAVLAPPGPAAESRRVTAFVLGSDTPVTCALSSHGPAATRRRYTRAAGFLVVVAVLVAIAQLAGLVTAQVWWVFAPLVPLQGVLAWDRARTLGHALLPDVLVGRAGSLLRHRWMLHTDGIIGWTIKRSFFQRRAGVATVVATTSAGRHRYALRDVPEETVWPLIESISLRSPSGTVVP